MERTRIETHQSLWVFNRQQTDRLLTRIAELPDANAALAWRAGAERAPIGWQLMHIGITEELFATSRLSAENVAGFAELVPRFEHGSTPDDIVSTIEQIREVLDVTRHNLLNTFEKFNDTDLSTVPEPLAERDWSLEKVLQVLNWHESHHQGQAHATLNLFLNQ